MKKKHNHVRLKDIAEEVGVSVSTVSIVLNGMDKERHISENVVTAIHAASRRLGYVTNMAAKQMRTGIRHINIALMTSYEAPLVLINSWLVSIDRILSNQEMSNMRFSITLSPFHANRLHEVINTRNFHAAIIANTSPTDEAFLKDANLSFPIVLINRRIPGFSTVRLDMEAAGKEAAEVMFKHGRKKLAVLNPPFPSQATGERLNSFISTSEQLGLPKPDVINLEQFNEDGAYNGLRQYFKKGGNFDGLFTLTDVLAVGAYQAIKSTGRCIPQDVAVLGFDGLSYSKYLDPPLSTFEEKRGLIYSEAVRIIVQMITHGFDENLEMTFKPKLVLRESVNNVVGD